MISKNEIRKDVLQESAEAVVSTTGQVASIVTNAVRDVTRALGGLGTEIFEIREAAKRAEQESSDTDPDVC